MNDPKLSRTIASTGTMRLVSIPSHGLLYTPLEERFERITRLARRALSIPVAAVTLISDDKQWFKSVAGWNVSELREEQTLCTWTVEHEGLHVIEDMTADSRTANHPFVVSPPRLRFYAGYPLVDAHDSPAGTFCVFDIKPREFSAADQQTLLDLAGLAQREFISDHLTNAHSSLTTKLSIARREAMMDPLTRLWNRRGVNTMVEAALEEVDSSNSPLAIAVMDLDNFKRINDSYGHQIGDEVLRKVATRLVGAIRSEDLTFRLGGDEFLLLMLDTNEETAKAIAERVRKAITDAPISTRSGNLPMSVSVGLTIRPPRETLTVDELLDRADQALMKSKADGRNRVRLAT